MGWQVMHYADTPFGKADAITAVGNKVFLLHFTNRDNFGYSYNLSLVLVVMNDKPEQRPCRLGP